MHSLWMLFASLMFSLMGVCVKLASQWYSTAEIVLVRGIVGVLFIYAYVRISNGTLRTAVPGQHLWRGAVGVTSLSLWFYSIAHLPLATAMTFNYMAPIWLAALLFAGGLLKGDERFEWKLSLAILVSFIGVILMLRPAFHADQWFPAMVGLGSGALSALAYLQVRKLGLLGEPDYRVVFYFSLFGMVAGLGATLLEWRMEAPEFTGGPLGLVLLLAIGITATIAQIAMTRAYRLGATLVTANLQYSGIIFASVWGVLIWGDVLGWQSWAGIILILVSGMAATYVNSRRTARRDQSASRQ